MALSAAIVWEVQTGGSDNNGGAFKAGATGTDRSQQTSAQVAIDNSAITTSIATSVITFTGGYSPSAADVGNVVQMLTGTNVTAGFYEITSISAGVSWTVDRNVVTSGTTTNATGNMGGCLLTLSKLAGAMVGSNKAFVKAGSGYTCTATNTFSAASVVPSQSVAYTTVEGYTTTRGDKGRFTLTLQTNTGITGLLFSNNGWRLVNAAVDCGSLGTSIGVQQSGGYGRCENVKVSNFTSYGIRHLQSNNESCFGCEITGGGSGATAALGMPNQSAIEGNWIHDNACPGIVLVGAASGSIVIDNLITNNTGASSDGIVTAGLICGTIRRNTIYQNGRDGIRVTDANPLIAGGSVRGNILAKNGGYGLNFTNSAYPALPQTDGNAYWTNTSGARNNCDSVSGIYAVAPYTRVFDVTLSADPFTNAGSNDYSLNATAGGGAACRGVGVPQTWPGTTTVGTPDLGAVQHADPAAVRFNVFTSPVVRVVEPS